MRPIRARRFVLLAAVIASACSDQRPVTSVLDPTSLETVSLDKQNVPVDVLLPKLLAEHRFTGQVGQQLTARLGRPLDPKLTNLGRFLFFDPINGLNDDNSCAGCHNPTNGFGDSQSIAIGIENNGIVGPSRSGPRNQRRTPVLTNIAFAPALMWNSRFFAGSGNPFDNSGGFSFPAPEGGSLSYVPHLLTAQAFIPPTERVEMAGFAFPGDNFAIRAEVARRLNATPAYRELFGAIFSDVRQGGPITFDHFGAAVAEFTFSLDFADAPIDAYARGNLNAMNPSQKRGAVLFFGRAGCVKCHAVKGNSNEMFSDFQQHVIGVPQIAPLVTNVTFDGPGADEDFGLEQVTGNPADRYGFRSSPLRNIALQKTFMHNGAYTRLEDAIRHHLQPYRSARQYDPAAAGVAPDLRVRRGPIEPVLAKLDPKLKPMTLTEQEFQDLVAFVRHGLLDPDATNANLRKLIPKQLPSGRKGHLFQ